mgnify:CR=1 FL=1
MLAAESAWAVLRAEHGRIRELLNQADDVVSAPGIALGAKAQALAEVVERLREFDEAIHRPKGALLLTMLQGRASETDQLLSHLATTRQRCDDLLEEVFFMLKSAEAGIPQSAERVPGLLAEHRALTLEQLEVEDTLLHSQSARHLTREEWAAIASSISDTLTQFKT